MGKANSRRKVLIAAGGSGGHIFPAVALGRKLKEEDPSAELLFVGSNKKLDRDIFNKEAVKFTLLSSNKLPYRPSMRLAPFFIRLFLDTLKSFGIVISYRPSVVVGFGGYISTPISLAAYLFGIPVITHEQNVVPGRANRLLFRLSRKVAISFKETEGLLGINAGKAVLTGNPVRATIARTSPKADSIKALGMDSGKFTVLVIGGSQGAHSLNERFVESLLRLDDKAKGGLQVIHITGLNDYGWVKEKYGRMRLAHKVYSFMDKIEDAYNASDLVVTRAGSSAIFEVALFGKPMILIPYPFAMSHQAENARSFSGKGAAIEIDEKDLMPETFKDKILKLMNDKDALNNLAESARRLSVPDASGNLAKQVLDIKNG